MAQLLVRNLDDDVKERLRQRAARRGHSMEEEVRDILRAAADQDLPPVSLPLGTRISQRFAGLGLTIEFPELRGEAASPPISASDPP
jgi:antitoxin FitA